MDQINLLSITAQRNATEVLSDSCAKRKMAPKMSIGLPVALLLASCIAAAQVPSSGEPVSRLAGDWRSSEPVTIPASGPPALPSSIAVANLGAAPAGTRLDRMILLLEPSVTQEQALDTELAGLQNPSSSNYHHWLTPAAFASAYSISASDVAAVSAWLQSQGFIVAPLPTGLGWIEFSGTAGQVEQAFHTQLNTVSTSAGTRIELAGKISVPTALQPVIHGIASLDGALSAPALTAPRPMTATAAELAAQTSLSHAEAASPELLEPLLHLDALHTAGSLGKGESIAIVARSNVQSSDITAFRTAFSLAPSTLQVVLNGADPGFTGDQANATMAASWAGAGSSRRADRADARSHHHRN